MKKNPTIKMLKKQAKKMQKLPVKPNISFGKKIDKAIKEHEKMRQKLMDMYLKEYLNKSPHNE